MLRNELYRGRVVFGRRYSHTLERQVDSAGRFFWAVFDDALRELFVREGAEFEHADVELKKLAGVELGSV